MEDFSNVPYPSKELFMFVTLVIVFLSPTTNTQPQCPTKCVNIIPFTHSLSLALYAALYCNLTFALLEQMILVSLLLWLSLKFTLSKMTPWHVHKQSSSS